MLFGLEAAILSAASQILGVSISSLLRGQAGSTSAAEIIKVNGLLDCVGSPGEAAAKAIEFTQDKGYACLKVKVSCSLESKPSRVK